MTNKWFYVNIHGINGGGIYMYEERKDSFSIRNVVIQFLFVALIIFICISLFPMKSDLDKAMSNMNKTDTDVSVLYDRIFNENVIAMKDAAKDYFTTPRLPNKLGETVKITLGEMLEKKIILPFVDKNGDQCDIVDSYVEVTKDSDEFVMKVNLKCSDQENYLLVHMGCYDYCQTAICEKNTSDVKTPVIYNPSTQQPIVVKPSTPDINIDIDIDIDNSNNNNNGGGTVEPEEPVNPEKKYLYQYKKVINGAVTETDWIDNGTTPVTADYYTRVKVRKVIEKVLKGYDVVTKLDKNKPIYGKKLEVIGTETITKCNKFDYISAGSATTTGTTWVYKETKIFDSPPTNTSTRKYHYVRRVDQNCGDCISSIGAYYEVYELSSVSTDLQKFACVSSSTQTIQLTALVDTITGYERVEVSRKPVYEEKTTKYYSYKKRTITGGTELIKWSTSSHDQGLINDGYTYTGQTKPLN